MGAFDSLNPANWAITDAAQGQGSWGDAGKALLKTTPGGLAVDKLKDTYESTIAGMGQVYSPENTITAQLGATDTRSQQNETQIGSDGTGNGTGSGGAQGYSANDLALIDSQISSTQSALERLLSQRNIGYGNIDASTQEARNKLMQERAIAERDYGLKKDQSAQDYTNTRAGLRANAGGQYTALQRLLGGAGAGRSSAAQIVAPFAVGREAAQRFGEVQDQFGRNNQAMDISYGDTNRQFDDYNQGLDRQREQKRRELESGILQNEAGLQDTLAQLISTKTSNAGGDVMSAIAPQQSRIQQILGQIDQLSTVAPVQAQGSVAYNAPELAQYDYSQFSTPETGQGGAQDYVSPLTALLSSKKKKEATV